MNSNHSKPDEAFQEINNENIHGNLIINLTVKETEDDQIQKEDEPVQNDSKFSTHLSTKRKPFKTHRHRKSKSLLNKGRWSPEEDEQLKALYKVYGRQWTKIADSMGDRTGKQVRDRFLNNFDNNVKKTKFTKVEDELILKLHAKHGNQWAKIASRIEGRTGDMIKNRYYSVLSKNSGKKNKRGCYCNSNKKNQKNQNSNDLILDECREADFCFLKQKRNRNEPLIDGISFFTDFQRTNDFEFNRQNMLLNNFEFLDSLNEDNESSFQDN